MINDKNHCFCGKWITNEEFCSIAPRNVFHKQLEPVELPCDEHRNRHILFRKNFLRATNGTRTRNVCLEGRNVNQLHHSCIVFRIEEFVFLQSR